MAYGELALDPTSRVSAAPAGAADITAATSKTKLNAVFTKALFILTSEHQWISVGNHDTSLCLHFHDGSMIVS